ncbi:MAG TPA: methyltransferase domain-containing protein [Acidimicrobiales bacterium]|nr:methyltransferase domain-containing protein [Acidimicrobiales bacterium]
MGPGDGGEDGDLAGVLARHGFVAAEEEAAELRDAAGGETGLLASLVRRRLAGEPLAWIVGGAPFCGARVAVLPGCYVPRWQSEPLARRAAARLGPGGTAVDVCTGTGALALALMAACPGARVVGTDLDHRAVACARANGVEAYHGDLFGPVPPELHGAVDVVVGVVPYVPSPALALLPRDTLVFESPLAYDGGPDGADVLRRVVAGAPVLVRPGGALLLETGAGQAAALAPDLARHGWTDVVVHGDEDGDERFLEARFTSRGA